jgi:hypothetical protein
MPPNEYVNHIIHTETYFLPEPIHLAPRAYVLYIMYTAMKLIDLHATQKSSQACARGSRYATEQN